MPLSKEANRLRNALRRQDPAHREAQAAVRWLCQGHHREHHAKATGVEA